MALNYPIALSDYADKVIKYFSPYRSHVADLIPNTWDLDRTDYCSEANVIVGFNEKEIKFVKY